LVPITGCRFSRLRRALRRGAGAVLVLACVAATMAGAPMRAQDASADFARRVQQHYDTVRDFSADFEQRYEGGALKRSRTERGTVVVKKPGKMRWRYTEPEEKLYVADGQKIYAYVPADKQVIVNSMPAGDNASTPVLFLVGKGELLRDFDVADIEIPGAPAGSRAIKLTPKQKEREYDWLALVVDGQSLALRMLVAGDSQGGRSTFLFSNLKENVGPPDNTFKFTVPRGADVITQG
jgi:outer membrane lipoprotein carrier protein